MVSHQKALWMRKPKCFWGWPTDDTQCGVELCCAVRNGVCWHFWTLQRKLQHPRKVCTKTNRKISTFVIHHINILRRTMDFTKPRVFRMRPWKESRACNQQLMLTQKNCFAVKCTALVVCSDRFSRALLVLVLWHGCSLLKPNEMPSKKWKWNQFS